MSDQKKQRFHVRRGDDVVVISGSAKGRRGKVREVLTGSLSVFWRLPTSAPKRVKKSVDLLSPYCTT